MFIFEEKSEKIQAEKKLTKKVDDFIYERVIRLGFVDVQEDKYESRESENSNGNRGSQNFNGCREDVSSASMFLQFLVFLIKNFPLYCVQLFGKQYT